MKESELFPPVKKHLLEIGCSEVYGEVSNVDVLGIKGNINIVVELKTSLSFKLIDQAIERTRIGHYVYIAIPKRKQSIPRCVKEILKTYKIGLIEVGKRSLRVTIPASYNRTANKRNGYLRIRKHIRPYHAEQIGGVKSGEAVSDYSLTIQAIKSFMEEQEGKWITADDIIKNCETHYKNPKPSVMSTLQEEWNQKWCESKVEKRKRYFRIKEVK